jgi:FtsH-binding integral membrane protein
MADGSRSAEAVMANAEEKRETGTSLMFIGLAVWVVDLLVVFFLPSGLRLGRQTMFISIIVALAFLGLVLMISGYIKRGKAGEAD